MILSVDSFRSSASATDGTTTTVSPPPCSAGTAATAASSRRDQPVAAAADELEASELVGRERLRRRGDDASPHERSLFLIQHLMQQQQATSNKQQATSNKQQQVQWMG
jgi:hypothetical protein